MSTSGVLLALLSLPATTIAIFLSSAYAVLSIYGLSDVTLSRKLLGRAVRMMPRWSVRSWWAVQRATWRRSKMRGTVSFAVGVMNAGRVVLAAALGFAFAIMVSGLLAVLRALNGEQFKPTLPIFPLAAGTMVGVGLFIGVIRYTTTARRSRLWPSPDFSFHAGAVSIINRYEFLRRVWLYTWLRRSAGTSVVLAVMISLIAFGSVGTAASSEPSGSEFTTQDLYALLWIVSIFVGAFVGRLVRSLIALVIPVAHAAVAVHRCLNYFDRSQKVVRRSGLVDVLGERRLLLDRVVRALDAEGTRIDLAVDHHPIGSILRGCSLTLRRFLRSTESLKRTYSLEITVLLNRIIVTLAGPADQRFLVKLGRDIDAFDSDGAPREALRVGTPRRWKTIATRTSDILERYARFGGALWGLFTLAAVAVLIAKGALDLSKIQLQK